MPRVSVRRMLVLTVYTVFVTCLVMLALHMHQPNALFRIDQQQQQQQQQQQHMYANNNVRIKDPMMPDDDAVELLVQQVTDISDGVIQDVLMGGGIVSNNNASQVIGTTIAAPNNNALRRHGLPWYLRADGFRPSPEHPMSDIWPSATSNGGDRIENQLLIPKRVAAASISSGTERLKKIYLPNGLGSWQIKRGQKVFLEQKCPVDNCWLTDRREDAATADAIMFKDFFSAPAHKRSPSQIWIMYMLECPLHTQYIREKDAFNWTATYRSDSELVAPYEKWVYYDPNVKRRPAAAAAAVNYAQNKTKKVAWFVSNCGAKNNRLEYAHALQKYIDVDIYGTCGTKSCPRHSGDRCLEILAKQYKFYLAFENSNCRDYITEKFYVNGLNSKVLPIVMGAPKEDYATHAPERSFIHVDDFATPKDLAEYLHALDRNDTLYNEYFEWRETGQFVNTYFFCRLCAMVNEAPHHPARWYHDFNEWWRGGHSCIKGSWRDLKQIRNSNNNSKRQAS